MSKLLSFGFLFLLLSSCGLKYEPPVTKKEVTQERQQIIENYIQKAYADSSVRYKSLFFGQPTVVKPESYKVLDSLYELKYQNELRGTFDKRLEETIGNQKNVIIQDAPNLRYVEDHVYAIIAPINSEINFSDVEVNGKNEVTGFKIKTQQTIPTEFIDVYQIYLGRESFMHPGYLATNEEQQFYTEYEDHMNTLPSSEQNEFLVHTLKIMFIAQKLRTLDKETLLKELSIAHLYNRKYNPETDTFISVDGVLVDKVLSHYLLLLNAEKNKLLFKFSPYLEQLSIEIKE